MIETIFTIGVYDTTEDTFFDALQAAEIDLFCDIRQRRAVRGKLYTYANSNKLQAKLKDLSIAYLHLLELAPTQALRESQSATDKQLKVARRKRAELSETFIQSYKEQILAKLDVEQFSQKVAPHKRICLFCVECLPTACHRSLVAAKLSQQLNITVEHLMPCQGKEF